MPKARPRFLLIETSGRVGQLALAEGQALLAEHSLDATRRHARDLAPTAARLLGDCGWRARDLQGVIVGLGPGSYTGLRVGIMSAKALWYATGCGVIGVPTFEVLARQINCNARELAVIADAQKELLYMQPFIRNSSAENFAPMDDLKVVPGRQWAERLRPNVVVSGPGVKTAEAWLPGGAATATQEPSISGLLAVGWERFERGDRDDAAKLEPLYLRRSSAEEQWDHREADGVTGCR